jgi:hypothetical protein
LGHASGRGKTEESDTVTSDVLEQVHGATAIVLEIFERNAAEGSIGSSLACDYNEPVGIPHR